MFYAIPLENRPTWRNPPWMTVLLIIINMVIFWGPQTTEDQTQEKAAKYYIASDLPALEFPEFAAWLAETKDPKAEPAKSLAHKPEAYPALLAYMESHPDFLTQLRAEKRIQPTHAFYENWKSERAKYESMQPAPFTYRWAQNFQDGKPLQPETLLTSAFLHGSTGHLLGNMLFLFLFGFSVELTLGRFWYLLFYLAGAVGGALLAQAVYTGDGNYGLGASGAVSALMGMYAVMYRLKRIRFFYQLFFYFNYVTAPALILLPVWALNELLQHFYSQEHVAYMAHLGGLVTGAALMALALALRMHTPQVASDASEDPFDLHVMKAKRWADGMHFDRAVLEWRAAAQLRPTDEDVLKAWFSTSKLSPASDDFHRAARAIFKLTSIDEKTLQWQHSAYQTYLDHAKPGARLSPEVMVHLVKRFTRARQWNNAEKLCQALLKTAPQHTGLADALSAFVNGLMQAGRQEQVAIWLPELSKRSPNDAMILSQHHR
jgi:membrane associated rhomboid family serine protease